MKFTLLFLLAFFQPAFIYPQIDHEIRQLREVVDLLHQPLQVARGWIAAEQVIARRAEMQIGRAHV